MKNTKSIGEASELMIKARLALQGESILEPYGDNERYDFAILSGRTLSLVQCKTGHIKNGAVQFKTCSTQYHRDKKSYSYKDDIDYFGVYCPTNDKCYFIPIDIVLGNSQCSLRIDPPKNNQKNGIVWAIDYEI